MRKNRFLIMGLCALCVFLAFFAAYQIMASGADMEYLLALQGMRESAGAWLTSLMLAVTTLGEFNVHLIIGVVLFWCVDKRAGERILTLGISSTGINQLAKVTACVYRPWVRDARIAPVPEALKTATGYSFPSGHTANGGTLTIGLWAWLKGKCSGKSARAALTAGLAIIWLLVGFSRNLLGVHTPQDVGVMLVLMLPVAALCEFALRYADRGSREENIVAGCGVAFGALLALWAAVKNYPLDYDAAGKLLVDPAVLTTDTFKTAGMVVGFFAGWLCERRFVRFSVEGKLWRRMLRGAAGIALMLTFDKLLTPVAISLIGALWGQFAAKLALFLVVMAGYPALIRAFARAGGRASAGV